MVSQAPTGRSVAAPDAAPVDLASLTDAQLLAECGERPDYFGEFYERHAQSVLTYLVRRVGCAQTAADLTSETFASALVSRRSFRPDAGVGLQWLYGIARNLVGKYFRKERTARRYQKRLAMRPTELSDDEISQVEERADLPALRDRIATALAALPEDQAEAVRLRMIEQRSYADIAVQVGAREGTVRVRVSRGLTALADMLEDVR